MSTEVEAMKCNVCSKPDVPSTRSRCKRVSYYNHTCQKADWKAHKKYCFKPNVICTRCDEIINDNNVHRCTAPHSPNLQQDCGSSFGGGQENSMSHADTMLQARTKYFPTITCKINDKQS
jgi:hypothetical protein